MKKRFRIATIIKDVDVYRYYPPFIEKLGEAMDVHVFYFKGSPPKNSLLVYHKVEYSGTLSLTRIFRILDSLLPTARREGFDAVYVLDGIFYEVLGYLLARKLNAPLIVRLRTNELAVRKLSRENPLKTMAWKTLHDYVLRKASAISCISHELCNYARSVTGPRKPIQLIYHGVDTSFFHRYRRRGPSTILTIGLTRLKGADIIIGVAKRLPSVKFVVIGRADKRYVKMLPRNVVYMGRVERRELVEIYNKAAITFMPSLTEGLPDALLESLACETPVYASPVGEIPYVIDSETGWLIREYVTTRISEEIKRIMARLDLVEEKGFNGRRLVEERFRWEDFISKTMGVLEEAVRRH